MVDCRPSAGAAPHEPHASPNGAPTQENHHTQVQSGGNGDMGNHAVTSPGARASTPAGVNSHVPYPAQYQSPAMSAPVNMPVSMGMGGVSPYMGYVMGGAGAGGMALGKGLVWMPPPLPPPPIHVNPHAHKSMQANGADLPMNDIPTLRYYFNLGVDCVWAAYGPPPPPPRHFSPRDIAQDMQQMSLQDRGNNHSQDMGHKHKGPPSDKQMQNNGKGNGQRSLLGPRFNKRGNGQDGNPNPNHNQNKNHNNNNHMANKGPNNRTYYSRNSEPRGHSGYTPLVETEGAVPETPMLTLPYIPYPPPVYPVQYYPMDASDPNMMGMMGGMQYMGGGYEELEYPQYYPPPPPPPFHPPPHAHHHVPACLPAHIEHK